MKYIWKKTISGILVAAMLISGMVTVNAEDEIRVFVEGEQVTFDQPPVMRNDRVLVPLRAVGEALGCEVHWYENTQSIGIGRNGNGLDDIVLKVGYPRVLTLTGNNIVEKVTEIDQPPIVENDRTLVPVRALAEAVGAEVNWNEAAADSHCYTVESQAGFSIPRWDCNRETGAVFRCTKRGRNHATSNTI